MRCPYCGCENTQVKDSRPTEENQAIRRRRNCEDCGGRFTTFERVQLREIVVIKRSGRRVAFDREKLSRSVEIALRKRPIQPERIDRMVSGIVRQLESMGELEVSSSIVGELVMEALKGLDPVAYVRFASVYRDFREAADFHEVLGEIAERATAGRGDGRRPQAAPPSRASTGSTEPRWPVRSLAPIIDTDRRFMQLALRVARRMLGRTAPNPAVGAVIADEATGEVIARGWTQPAAARTPKATHWSGPARVPAARPCTSRWSLARITAARRRAQTPSSPPACAAWCVPSATRTPRSPAGAWPYCATPASTSTSASAPRRRAGWRPAISCA